ncbi:fructosamine kinase family protein [Halocola ammonii]
MPEDLKQELSSRLSAFTKKTVKVESVKSVGGGSINHAARVLADGTNYFVKWNKREAFPQMFDKEQSGLELLSRGNHIRIPNVIATGELDSVAYLLTEWIESGSETDSFWEEFGQRLANLHREIGEKFGLDHDNYMGSLRQSNTWESSWAEFFIKHRIEPQVRMAVDAGFTFSSSFDHIYNLLQTEVPEESPSLIHGDLWSGNFIVDSTNAPVLIDPATYFGHRESDIAMTTLFGGFSAAFYESYNNSFAMESGWQERLPLHNLYPLLVHVNLFGSGYVNQVNQILRNFK